MNIAIMCHNRKQELMVQFCTAYCGLLSKHTLYAPPTPLAEWWRRLPACPSICSSPTSTGGIEQIGQRIIYNEIDMVLFFNYPPGHRHG